MLFVFDIYQFVISYIYGTIQKLNYIIDFWWWCIVEVAHHPTEIKYSLKLGKSKQQLDYVEVHQLTIYLT